MPTRRPPDPVAAYARSVVAGKTVANRFVRQACQRHLDDLRRARERGLVWDRAEASRVIALIGQFRLPSGQPFVLRPSQAFIVGSLFGWYLTDGARRFRTAYIEMGKGNGKTPLAAAIGIVGVVADGRRSAEVYTAGVTRDQAHYLWRDGRQIVEASPTLRGLFDVGAHNLAVPATDSYMRPVSSEARSLDQKRVHMALIDEIHEHETPLVVEKMRAGTKGDETALIVEITNSGYDRTSICWQHHEYSLAVLEGTIENASWFAFVAGIDEGDDWLNDETCWAKANPLLGVTVTARYLREQVQEARDMPAHAALVARLNFCVWTEASAGAMAMDRWDAAGPVALIPLGATVYAGLDLSSTTDIASLVLLYEDEAGVVSVEPYFWCPAAAVEVRSRRDHLPYDVWAAMGELTVTEGDVIDYDAILAAFTALSERYQIAECAYLRMNATQFVTAASGLTTMVPVGQTYQGLSAATKDWLARIAGSTRDAPRIRHGGNQALRWMAANLVVETTATGDIKPSNGRSTERITGQTAAILALGRLVAPHDAPAPEPGILAYWRRLAGEQTGPSSSGADRNSDRARDPDPTTPEQTPVPPILGCAAQFRDHNAIAVCGRPAGHCEGHAQ
ncbi:MAG: terminase large subunit [Candidatus Limnocylindrales bacterium]